MAVFQLTLFPEAGRTNEVPSSLIMMRRAAGTAASAGISTATGHTRACSFYSLASAVRRPVLSSNAFAFGGGGNSGLVRCWRTTTVGSLQGIAGARATSSAPIRSGNFAVLQDEDVAFFRWLILALETPHFFAVALQYPLVAVTPCAINGSIPFSTRRVPAMLGPQIGASGEFCTRVEKEFVSSSDPSWGIGE